MAKSYKIAILEKRGQAKKVMSDVQFVNCNNAIHIASVSCASAGAVPIPTAAAFPVNEIQISMIMAIGRIFGVEITETIAKDKISSVASTFFKRSLVKLIPFVGWGVSGAVSADVTEAIGWTIAVDVVNKVNEQSEQESELTNDENTASSNLQDAISEEKCAEMERIANEFISGRKSRLEYPEEYNSILLDIQNNLDGLPDNHSLNEIYMNLIDIV